MAGFFPNGFFADGFWSEFWPVYGATIVWTGITMQGVMIDLNTGKETIVYFNGNYT